MLQTAEIECCFEIIGIINLANIFAVEVNICGLLTPNTHADFASLGGEGIGKSKSITGHPNYRFTP